ncbi:MAG: alanine racemase C-terminal domain-containing protein, partial [Tepidimonas sp.]|uniref:alanine racemase C-terminal domain-containing protein n=1 Tax=Tepidimonas sp. TaxID=2002775 RepID=UPI004054C142
APSHDAQHWGLQPTMTLASRLIGIQDVAAGESVGYGSAYVAPHRMRVGIVACGYADGYPRHASLGQDHGAPVLVRGVRTRLVGRVSMDMLAVDLTPVEADGAPCRLGDEVVLWGRSAHGPVLPVDEVARAAGTIAYELLCAVAPRVPMAAEEQ